MARDGKYDLEERTFVFARDVRKFLKSVPRNICNINDADQLTRSSGSVGADYIEANESLGKKISCYISKSAARKQKRVITG